MVTKQRTKEKNSCTFTPQIFKIIITLSVPFYVKKGGIFIVPNGFKNGAKKCIILVFQGTSGTTVITGWYYRLQSDIGQYYCSV